MYSIFAPLRSFLVGTSLFLFSSLFCYASDLVLVPPSGTYVVGKKVTVQVYLKNNTQSINAISGRIQFPDTSFSLPSISKDGSILGLWAEEPVYSAETKTVHFEGVILGGYDATAGKVLTFSFTAKQAGKVSLSFADGAVLANDGNATSVLDSKVGSSYTFVDTTASSSPTTPVVESAVTSPSSALVPKITSDTHPIPGTWYSSKNISLSWTIPSGTTAVRTLFDGSESSIPNVVYGSNVTSKNLIADKDGSFYFHLQYKNNNGWGAVAHFPVLIDTVRPEQLTIKVLETAESKNVHPQFVLSANDSLSGVDYFSVKIDNSVPVKIVAQEGGNTTYTPESLFPGSHVLFVRAYDKAGNAATESLEFYTAPLRLPKITYYPSRIETIKNYVITNASAEVDSRIKGESSEGETVQAIFTDSNGKEHVEVVDINEDRTFDMSIPSLLNQGVYTVRVRAVNAAGEYSFFTEQIEITVKDSPLATMFGSVVNWLTVITLLLLAGMLVAGILWYGAVQFIIFKENMKRKLAISKDHLTKDVRLLKEDLVEYYQVIAEKKTNNKRMTREESLFLATFQKHLQDSEKNIETILKGSK